MGVSDGIGTKYSKFDESSTRIMIMQRSQYNKEMKEEYNYQMERWRLV